MSLFGAATSGVDPQTGSYLNKKQRIAMFRASQGRGGDGGASGAGDKKQTVQASSAIVVANKMTSVVQTLQSFTQENVQNVSVQVLENRKNIENLYNSVAEARQAEAKEEAIETKQKRFELGKSLKRGREALIEGISSAVSGTIAAVQKGVSTAFSPFQGLFQKLLSALGLIGGAWVIDNLENIIDAIEGFSLEDLQTQFVESLGTIRGVWSILDVLLGGVKRAIRRIATAGFRVARFIASKAFNISKRIVRSLGRFIGNIASRVISNLLKLSKKGIDGLVDGAQAAKRSLQGADAAADATRAGGAASDATRALPPASSGRKGIFGAFDNMMGSLTSWGKGAYKSTTEALGNMGSSLSTALGDAQRRFTGVEVKPDAERVSWLRKALRPLTSRFPALKNAIGDVLGFANKIFKIPGIGFAIDLALNKGVAGQDWTEAIIRAGGSSIGSGIGIAGGMKLGAIAGAIAGAPFAGVGAVPGAAIGTALGAFIGALGGGAIGDQLGAMGYEAVTGNERTDNTVMGQGAIDSIIGSMDTSPELGLKEHTEQNNYDYNVTGNRFSDYADGMDSNFMAGPQNSGGVNFIDMPPSFRDMTRSKQRPEEEKVDESGAVDINFSSSDPDMSMYREMAEKTYQMTWAN